MGGLPGRDSQGGFAFKQIPLFRVSGIPPSSSLGWGPPLDPHKASAKERVIFLRFYSVQFPRYYITSPAYGQDIYLIGKGEKKRPEVENLASSVLLRPGSLFSHLTGCAKHGRWTSVACQGRK